MTSLTNALEQLRSERGKAQSQVEKLDQAISAIESLNGSIGPRRAGSQRIISAEARRKMSLAQKARRSRERGNARAARPPLSVAARKKIASAQRARWARFRAQQKAA